MTIAEGNLNASTIRSVLQLLRKNKWLGAWLVSDGRDEKVIHVRKDQIRLYSSQGRRAGPITEHLVRQELVDRKQMELAVAQSKSGGLQELEELLTAGHAISKEAFREEVERLIYFELCDLVTWPNAVYELCEDTSPEVKGAQAAPVLSATLDMESMVTKVDAWISEWESIEPRVGSESVRPLVVPDSGDIDGKKELSVHLGVLLSLLNGRRDLSDLSRDSGLPVHEVIRAVDEGLRDGFLEVNPPSENELASPHLLLTEIERFEENLPKAICTNLVHRCIASRYERLGREDSASKHYEAIGNLQVREGFYAKARVSYGYALKLAPQNITAHENLIRLLELTDDKAAALDEIYTLSKKLVAFGLLEEAISFLKRISRKISDRVSIRLYLAQLLTQQEKIPEAVNEYLDIARCRRRKGSPGEVEEMYRRALSIDPKNRKARRLLKREVLRKSNRRAVWLFRVPTLAALIIMVAWLTSVIMAKQEWESANEEVLQVVEDGRVEEGLQRVRDIARRYPANLLVNELVSLESELYKEAFYEFEKRMEEGVELSNVGRCAEAVHTINRVLTHSLVSDQRERARGLIDDIENFRDIWLKTRRRSEILFESGLRKEAFSVARQVIENYPEGADALKLPFLIQTNTPGARVTVDGTLWGYTPLWIHVQYGQNREVRVEIPGYPIQTLEDLDERLSPYIHIDFREKSSD